MILDYKETERSARWNFQWRKKVLKKWRRRRTIEEEAKRRREQGGKEEEGTGERRRGGREEEKRKRKRRNSGEKKNGGEAREGNRLRSNGETEERREKGKRRTSKGEWKEGRDFWEEQEEGSREYVSCSARDSEELLPTHPLRDARDTTFPRAEADGSKLEEGTNERRKKKKAVRSGKGWTSSNFFFFSLDFPLPLFFPLLLFCQRDSTKTLSYHIHVQNEESGALAKFSESVRVGGGSDALTWKRIRSAWRATTEKTRYNCEQYSEIRSHPL